MFGRSEWEDVPQEVILSAESDKEEAVLRVFKEFVKGTKSLEETKQIFHQKNIREWPTSIKNSFEYRYSK